MRQSIFISYRRSDSQDAAARVAARLEEAFGADRVAFDVDALEYGPDYLRQILGWLDRSAVVLAVVGPTWLDVRGDLGVRRLDQTSDVVRIELEYAMQSGVRVIPVLIRGAEMPSESQLPAALADFARCNAIELRHTYFTDDVKSLVGALRAYLPQKTLWSRVFGGAESPAPGRTLDYQPFVDRLAHRDDAPALPQDQEGVRFLPIMQPNASYMDRFLIRAHLGRGGFADVYLARDRARANAEVALKLFRLDAQSTGTARLIETEVAMATRLAQSPPDSPGIVRIREAGWLPRKYGAFLVLDYLSGQSLKERLDAVPFLADSDARGVAMDLCDALAALHARGIAHCDVKPGNILLAEGARTQNTLVDLGSAQFLNQNAAGHLATTAPYAAPELDEGGAITPRVDVFGLGMTLVHALAGLPTAGADGVDYDFTTAASFVPARGTDSTNLYDQSLDLLHRLPNPRWQQVLGQAIAREAEARPADMKALRAALVDCFD